MQHRGSAGQSYIRQTEQGIPRAELDVAQNSDCLTAQPVPVLAQEMECKSIVNLGCPDLAE